MCKQPGGTLHDFEKKTQRSKPAHTVFFAWSGAAEALATNPPANIISNPIMSVEFQLHQSIENKLNRFRWFWNLKECQVLRVWKHGFYVIVFKRTYLRQGAYKIQLWVGWRPPAWKQSIKLKERWQPVAQIEASKDVSLQDCTANQSLHDVMDMTARSVWCMWWTTLRSRVQIKCATEENEVYAGSVLRQPKG